MPLWVKKKLLTDASPEALAKACSILKAAGISHRVQSSPADAPMFGSFAENKFKYGQSYDLLYTLYVRRKDYTQAKSLLTL